jgi:hypothetical protein
MVFRSSAAWLITPCLVVGLGLPGVGGQRGRNTGDFDRLLARQGQPIRLVVEDMDGKRCVAHFIVPRPNRGPHEMLPKYPIRTRPGSRKDLVAEYLEKELGRPLLTSRADQDRLFQARLAPSMSIRRIDERIKIDGRLFRIVRLEPLELKALPVPCRAKLVAVRLRKEDDPWQTTRRGGPSAWVIRFQVEGASDSFEVRIPNLAGDFRVRGKLETAQVTRVQLGKPDWQLHREEWLRIVPFTVQHTNARVLSGQVRLDERGIPEAGEYCGNSLLKRAQVERLNALRRGGTLPGSRRAKADRGPGAAAGDVGGPARDPNAGRVAALEGVRVPLADPDEGSGAPEDAARAGPLLGHRRPVEAVPGGDLPRRRWAVEEGPGALIRARRLSGPGGCRASPRSPCCWRGSRAG